MLLWLQNLDFAGGGTVAAVSGNRGGWGDTSLTRKEKEYLARLRLQQSRLKDDEEALAILLASLTRRH